MDDEALAFAQRRRQMLDDVVRAWQHYECDERAQPLTVAEYERWCASWQGAPAAAEALLAACGGSWSSVLRLSGVAWMPVVITWATPPADEGDWHQHVVLHDGDSQRHYRDGRLAEEEDTLSREGHLELLAAALREQPDLVWLSFTYWLEAHGHAATRAATLYLYFSSWAQAVAAARTLDAFQSAQESAARSRAICRSREAIDGASHQSSRLEPRSAC